MRFAIPHMLWLLLFVPVIGAYLVWTIGLRRDLLTRFGTTKALSRIGVAAATVMTWVRTGLFLLGVFALIVALARPQWGFHERRIVTRGVDLMIAIDTSASMMARDFPPTRLSRAKDLLKNLIWEAKGSRVGVVAFAGSSVVMCPLTLDYNMASTALKAVDVNTVSSQGTNIGSAINAAVQGFQISGGNDRILVLLTDGEQTEQIETLDAAVGKAVEDGVRIFAIGIGSSQGATILTNRGPKRDAQGNVVTTKLDFEKLQEIGTKTKGVAIRAEKIGASEIAEISSQLAKFKGQKQEDKSVRVYHDRYSWFLGVAFICFILEALLRTFRGFHIPRRRRKATIAGTGTAILLALLVPETVFAYPGEAFVRAREAYQKFNAGEYDQSLALYKRAAELSPQDPQLLYNMGAAAAKANKIEEAKKAFRSVYDPAKPLLNAEALFAASTLDHRAVRETIKAKKEEWTTALAGNGEATEAAKKEIQQNIDKLKPIIADYKKAITIKDKDVDMKTNFEIAKRELEELEKMLEDKRQQEQQQQQQQPQNNEQQKENEQKQNQEGQQGQGQPDQQQGESQEQKENQQQPQGQQGEQKPEEPKPGEGEQEKQQPENKGQEKEEQQGQGQPNQQPDGKPGEEQQKDQQPDPRGTPAPTPTPSPTPAGTPRPGEGTGQQGPAPQGTPVPVGQMSPTDVDRLLNTLPPEDQQALQIMFGAGPANDRQDMNNDW